MNSNVKTPGVSIIEIIATKRMRINIIGRVNKNARNRCYSLILKISMKKKKNLIIYREGVKYTAKFTHTRYQVER